MLNDNDKQKIQKHIGYMEEGNFERVSDSSLSAGLVDCSLCEELRPTKAEYVEDQAVVNTFDCFAGHFEELELPQKRFCRNINPAGR